MSGIRELMMALGLCALACGGGGDGGGGPGPQPTTPQPSPTTQPSPTPSPSPSPTPTPAPSPSPSPTPTPTPTIVSGGDGVSLLVERVDAAPECDGIVPEAAPPPVAMRVTAPAGASCLGGTGDGTGHVAVGYRSAGAATWTVFGADGARAGEVSGAGLAELVRQPRGWHGLGRTPLYSPFEADELVAIGPDGAVAARQPLSPPAGYLATNARLAGDPAGGSGVALAVAATGGNHPSRTEAFRFDAGAAPVHGDVNVMTDGTPVVSFLGAGVSTAGEMVATYRTPGTFAWRWIGRDGALLAQGSALQVEVGANDPVRLEPLLDGSVAVRFGDRWAAVLPHLGTSAVAAPEWLSARPGSLPRLTRGARGYAVMPPSGAALADCAQAVELRAASGRLCGRVELREASGGCTSAGVEQGWDGTLIQASARDTCSSASCSCTVHAWPRLLAAP